MNKSVTKSLESWFLSRLSGNNAQPHSLDPLEQLTVVIISYCRQPFILRQIVYWMRSPAKVVILDGSPNPLNETVRQALTELPSTTYIHNPVGVVERISQLKDAVTTPYVVMLGDDEFHLMSGLRKALLKLQENSEFSGCIGQSVRFYLSADKSQILYGTGYSHFKFESSASQFGDRLAHALKNYNSATCYSVLKVDAWRESWASLQKTSCKDVCEAQQAIATYAVGKFSTVDEIYWLRSDENVSVQDHNDFKDLSFPEWWRRPRYANERERLINALSELGYKYGCMSVADADAAVRVGFELFNESYMRSNHRASLLSAARLKGILVVFLQAVLPEKIYAYLKSVGGAYQAKNPLEKADLGSRAALSGKSNELFKYDPETNVELAEIETLICEFYEYI